MIVILDYGVGNLTSLSNCFKRLGYDCRVSSDSSDILSDQPLVLPGVGRFETAVTALQNSGTLPALEARRQAQRPILGICLGMQLFFESSEESPGFKGLGWLKGTVKKLPDTLPLPHMGWNTIAYKAGGQSALKNSLQSAVGGDMYFVHSYVADPVDGAVVLLETLYNEAFPALVGDVANNLFGLQGHPEKSGAVGESILRGLLMSMSIEEKKIERLAAMDLLDGQVVRLKQGNYNASTVFGDPEYFAGQLKEMDFDGLHLINLNGAKGEPLRNLDIICRLATSFPLKVQVGGGIRTWQDAERLLFLGCNVIVSTWFFEGYDSLKALVEAYPGRVSLSLDFKEGQVMTRGWLQSQDSPLELLLEKVKGLPLASLILTDIESDGMGSGMRLEFFDSMAKRIKALCPNLPLTAAGGMPLGALDLMPIQALGYAQAVIGLSLYKALGDQPSTSSSSTSSGDSYA